MLNKDTEINLGRLKNAKAQADRSILLLAIRISESDGICDAGQDFCNLDDEMTVRRDAARILDDQIRELERF